MLPFLDEHLDQHGIPPTQSMPVDVFLIRCLAEHISLEQELHFEPTSATIMFRVIEELPSSANELIILIGSVDYDIFRDINKKTRTKSRSF